VGFELFIAGRYLLARRRQAFISVISLISTLGVVVGVMALIIALALMTGLQRELRDRILGSTAHIYVWHQGGIDDYRVDVARITKVKGVVGAAPAVNPIGLISTDDGARAQVTVKGVDPVLEPMVTDIGRSIVTGSLQALSKPSAEGVPGILIGKNLAEKLDVRVGDRIKLLTEGSARMTPGGLLPRQRVARGVAT
jgi:lipoprotein-releasing system permease protein